MPKSIVDLTIDINQDLSRKIRIMLTQLQNQTLLWPIRFNRVPKDLVMKSLLLSTITRRRNPRWLLPKTVQSKPENNLLSNLRIENQKKRNLVASKSPLKICMNNTNKKASTQCKSDSAVNIV